MTQVYTISNVSVRDPEQLDQFFLSYLSNVYSRLIYFADSQTLNVFTSEKQYSATTLTNINNILAQYPDAPPKNIYPDETLKLPGDLITYDSDKQALSRISAGLDGQLLTSDSSDPKGIGWRSLVIEGANGSRAFLSDLYCRYFEIYNSGSAVTITSQPTSVIFNVVRRKDIPTYTFAVNNPDRFAINEGGPYTIIAKVGVEWKDTNKIPSYDAVLACYVSVVPPGGSNAQQIPYSVFYIILPSTVNEGIKVTRMTLFNYFSINGGEIFYLNVQELTSTNNVVIAPEVCSFAAMKLIIGSPSTDVSNYYNAYDALGNSTISSTTWTVIPMLTNASIVNNVNFGPLFTTNSDGTILIGAVPGMFMYLKVGTQPVNAAVGDRIEVTYRMTYNTGSGWVEQPLTRDTLFMVVTSSNGIPPMKTNAVLTAVGFPPNTLVRFEAMVTMNTGSGTVTTIPNASSVYFLMSASSDVGSNNVHGLQAYNASTVSLYKNHWTDLPFGAMVLSDGIFGQNTDNTITQSSEPGTYVVAYRIGFNEPQGSQFGMVTTRMMINGGAGFYEAVSARNSIFYRGSSPSASIAYALIYLGYNNQIKIQTWLEDIGPNSSSYAEIAPYGGSFIMSKFENTIEPLPVPGATTFGSYHMEVESTETEVTVSTGYVPKLTLSVNNVPQGTYRINCKFNWSASTTTQPMYVVLTQDNSLQVAKYTFQAEQSNSEKSFYDFQMVSLSAGNHSFLISWASNDTSSAAYISKTKMEFWRVS